MRVSGYTHFNNIPEVDEKNLISFFKEEFAPLFNNDEIKDFKPFDIINAFISIESIAFVLHQIFPDDNNISLFRDIITGRDLKSFKNLSEEHKRMIQAIHVLFPEMRSQYVLHSNIKIYNKIKYSNKQVIFNFERDKWIIDEGTFQWVNLQVLDRGNKYKKYLLMAIEHSKQECKYPKKDSIVITDYENKNTHIINLKDEKYGFVKPNQKDYNSLSIEYSSKKPLIFTKEQLLNTAQKMDLIEQELGFNDSAKMNWENRIKDIQFTSPSLNGLTSINQINIFGVQHWVGKLSVGKSTLMDIIAFAASQNDQTSVLVLNSVSDVFKKVDYFSKLGIRAVPLVSYNSREKHIKEYLDSIAEETDIYNNKSLYYLCTTCLLKGLDRESETEYLKFKIYPCHRIQDYNDEEENDDKKGSSSSYKTCPFIIKCPYFNAFHDLKDAQIIITTPQSMTMVNIPRPFTKEKISVLEYLIRTAHLMLVDEADRVQDTLDSVFINEVTLLDKAGGYINKILLKLQTDQLYNTSFMYNEDIMPWINDLHVALILLNRIGNFLTSDSNRDVIYKMDIKNIPSFSGFGLWLDLAYNISNKISVDGNVEEEKQTEIYQKEADLIRSILVNYYEEFRKTFLKADYSALIGKELCEIAVNITNYDKLNNDIEKFVNNDMEALINSEFKERNIRRSKLSLNINVDTTKWIYFIVTISLLEIKLQKITEQLPLIKSLMPKIIPEDDGLLKDLFNEFDGIIPSLPISVHHGFQYIDSEGYPTLKLLKYTGVGRYILYNLSSMYKTLDNHQGAHCVLLSGTSCAPNSIKYNVDLSVKYLIKSNNDCNSRIDYKFLSTFSDKISGILDYKEKESHYFNIIRKLTERDQTFGTNQNQIERILNELEEERKRVLIIVGSYDDAAKVSNMLNKALKEMGSPIKSLCLKRPSSKENDEYYTNHILRQKVHSFAEKEEEILVAPLLALERGYNILVDKLLYEDQKIKVAAFGAAIFFNRPYHIPNDFKLLVNRLNSHYIKTIKDNPSLGKYISLTQEVKELKDNLYKEYYRFKSKAYGYQVMEKEEREQLLADTFVNTFQLEGRLIRGGVNAKIYFVDSSFAPNTVAGTNDDSIETSMLLGWKYIWQDVLNSPTSEEEKQIKVILEELYSIRIDGLKNINVAEGVKTNG